ncbi:MAG: Rpn family recombination-promoting nuclease/putative transposase [Albidovulum sp.]|nr:Rpn family recombination-promoting nuclease/putative transposase [Albidovulum sp.]
MRLPHAKHDALFRLLISDPRHAADLLQDYLPPEVASRLDPARPPELVEGASVDGDGAATRMDALFRVWIRGDGAVYVLLEHKSYCDQKTPVQIMNYTLTLYKASEGRDEVTRGKLPLVIPLVFYHGRGPWNIPLSIEDMIHVPPGWRASPTASATTRLSTSGGSTPGIYCVPWSCGPCCWRSPGLAPIRSPTTRSNFWSLALTTPRLGRHFLTYVMRQL